jgi:hypothetical protein
LYFPLLTALTSLCCINATNPLLASGSVEDTFSIISQTEKFNIPVRASVSSSGTAANALSQPPKGFVTSSVQNSGTANRVTVLKEEPKPVPDFLARDWVVDPNLSLGEVQVGCCTLQSVCPLRYTSVA